MWTVVHIKTMCTHTWTHRYTTKPLQYGWGFMVWFYGEGCCAHPNGGPISLALISSQPSKKFERL